KAHSTEEHENDAVYPKAVFYDMLNALNSMEEEENDLKSFKEYIEKERADENSSLYTAISGIQYTYNTDLLIYTKNVDGNIIHSDTQELMQQLLMEYMGADVSSLMNFAEQSPMSGMSMMESASRLWKELIPGDNGKLINPVLEEQYDLIYGNWPTRYDEIVLFVDENNELDDLTLYALGLKSKEDIDAIFEALTDKTEVDYPEEKWSYEDICNMDFRTILSSDCYTYDEVTGTYKDLRDTDAGLKYLYDNALTLHVVGIVKPDENALGASGNGAIGYTSKLTEYIIEHAQDSEALKAQKESEDTDIFTGLPFKDTDGKIDDSVKAKQFQEYIKDLDENGKASAYVQIKCIAPDEMVEQSVSETMAGVTRDDMIASLIQAMQEQMAVDTETLQDYINDMDDEELRELFSNAVEQQVRAQYAASVMEQLQTTTPQQLAAMLDAEMEQYTEEQCAVYYEEVLLFSDSSYEENMLKLGQVDLDSPASINLYATTFEDKDVIEAAITAYNETVDDLQEIHYTDYVGLMMSSVTTIINAITYVLIAFVAVSLIVSSIMVGVITLISVQERTKEIGILRAIGASKKNVSNMFTAETVIIGFISGAMGVLITYLLCIPINAILHNLTGINDLSAYLPPVVAGVLILISVLLTLIAGIIPSRSAAKKDPVVALRTE
ncbi:MAG: ABC transporter permease, partial [Lachnospiraceae bacterium]